MASILAKERSGSGDLGLASWAARLRSTGEIGAMVGIFAVLRIVAGIHTPITYPDTVTYLQLNFLGYATRLWTVPLVWNIFSTNELREAVQLLLGIISWSVLAVAIGRIISGEWTRRIAVAAVLMFGLLPQVAGWDPIMLSESLSASLFVLLVGLLFWLSIRPTPALIVGCLAVLTLWLFTRQLNVLIFFTVLPFVVAYAIWRGPPRQRVWIVGALLIIYFWAGWAVVGPPSQSRAGRSVAVYSAIEILELDIAPHPNALQFFYAHGLPHSPAILADRGTAFTGDNTQVFQDPRILQWANNGFRSTYFAYLLDHLPRTIAKPLGHIFDAVSGASYSDAYGRTVLPSVVIQEFWNPSILFWFVVASALTIAVYRRGSRIRSLPVILLLFGTAVAGTIVTWNTTGFSLGEPDFTRIFLPISLMLRLAVLITIFLAIDALTVPRRARRPLEEQAHPLGSRDRVLAKPGSSTE